ncbi:phage tail sheath family protein [Solimonas soli]|uniref:phage tail sheath family protein n=1 Tax=Solimonas soli TaxID=413479 RepID=UPI00048081CF|nr:phage tail sheath subtilisin-like domain-containing protein [Solimonas soli]
MPEYLAPGVYVEETSFRAKSIEGVSTTTTGFVGPALYGPLDIEPDIVTSLVEFERTYGGREQLQFDDGTNPLDNYLWHAARAFFEEGGKRLYISRVFEPADESPHSGHAQGLLGASPAPLEIYARFPGRAGNARVTFTFRLGQNVLAGKPGDPQVRGLLDRDVVLIRDAGSPAASPPAVRGFYLARRDTVNDTWVFSQPETSPDESVQLDTLVPGATELRVVTVAVTIEPTSGTGTPFVVADLPLDPRHERAGSPDSLFAYFDEHPASLSRARTVPLVIGNVGNLDTGTAVLQAFFAAAPAASPLPGLEAGLEKPDSSDTARSVLVTLTGGNDGARPGAGAYEGTEDPATNLKTGLLQFEDLEDISIVAAPGSTFGLAEGAYADDARAITGLLISHAERMRYRIAVLDSGNDQSISEVRAHRAQLDSKYAALYYPWVRVLDPVTQREINLPPSGFVAGIYARNDVNRAVYKAPANEVVNLALGFEKFINKAQQEVLNPEGVNCFRYFEGRGMRLWGARTISSDPEWKYVNLRRYFAYLERSIDKGTQWAVFEPNGERLWANVRRTIEDFLLNEWQNGALLGDKPEKSFFVKCDRSTMSQNDLDNGRLVCLVGVAPLRPAEFVIFRVGQWTADVKV